MGMQVLWGFLLLAWWGDGVLTSHTTPPPAEHKIHNIVLYPDKHSWCKTTEIKQIVTFPKCNSVEIDNNVCVGACFSYSIPGASPAAPGEVITPYCDSCQPQHFTWKEVKLKCESDDEEEETVEMTKRVQVITNCTCDSCDKLVRHHDHHKASEITDDVPELMSLMMQQNSHREELEEIDEDNEETIHHSYVAAPESVKNEHKAEIDNVINVDEEKEKNEDEPKEENKLEWVHVNKHESGFHLEEGPHHSLIIKPDVVPEHNHTVHHRHHAHRDETEEVPSLLKNVFKDHHHEEFPDQLAVESQKQFSDATHVLSVPELILQHEKSEEKETKEKTIESEESKVDAKIQHESLKGVKIVEVSHDHLTPAVEGAHMSYAVKHN